MRDQACPSFAPVCSTILPTSFQPVTQAKDLFLPDSLAFVALVPNSLVSACNRLRQRSGAPRRCAGVGLTTTSPRPWCFDVLCALQYFPSYGHCAGIIYEATDIRIIAKYLPRDVIRSVVYCLLLSDEAKD